MVSYTVDDDGANGPEHLQHLGGGSSQLDGRNLTAVRGGVGNEDTPRNTLEKLRDEHDWQRRGKVEDQDEAVEEHEAGDGRPSISNSTGEGSSETDADDSTERTAHLERRLPAGYNDPFVVVGVVLTELPGEFGQSDEVTHEEHTIRLHDLETRLVTIPHWEMLGGKEDNATYDCAGHDKGPSRSHRVGLDGVHDAHVVFGILSLYSGGLVVCFQGLLVHGGILDLGGDALLSNGRVAVGRDMIGHADSCRLW